MENSLKIIGIILASIFGIFVALLLFMSLILTDFSRPSSSQVKEIVASPQFKVIESYLLTHQNIDHMLFCGSGERGAESEKTNVWQVNEYLIDFSTNEIIEIPDNVTYYTKEDLKRQPNTTTATLKEFQAKNKAAYDRMDIAQLRSVSENALKFSFLSIYKLDTLGGIQYSLQYNSPLSEGYGILYSSDTAVIHANLHDEIEFLSDNYYQYTDGVE